MQKVEVLRRVPVKVRPAGRGQAALTEASAQRVARAVRALERGAGQGKVVWGLRGGVAVLGRVREGEGEARVVTETETASEPEREASDEKASD